jgi:uncharacterized protein (TIGR02147 family)
MRPYFLQALDRDLQQRKGRNPRYSLRAYSKSLGCDPSALSRILNGKQEISVRLARSLSKKINLSEDERRSFLASVAWFKKEKAARALAEGSANSSLLPQPTLVPPEVLERLLDLRYTAILECTELTTREWTLPAIARELGLPLAEVEERVATLLAAGLVELRAGTLRKAKNHVRLETDTSSPAYQRLQKQLHERIQSAQQAPHKDRFGLYIRNMTMSADPLRVEQAQKMVDEFVEQLCDFVEQGDRTHLFHLAVELFPLKWQGAEPRQLSKD